MVNTPAIAPPWCRHRPVTHHVPLLLATTFRCLPAAAAATPASTAHNPTSTNPPHCPNAKSSSKTVTLRNPVRVLIPYVCITCWLSSKTTVPGQSHVLPAEGLWD